MSDELERIKKQIFNKIMAEDFTNEEDIVQALQFMKELRLYAINMDMEPWSLRQALILTLEMDTIAMLEKGIPQKNIDQFDDEIRRDLKSWLQSGKMNHIGPQGP
jgi:dTDP-4-dehydrorhamnose reductase